MQNTPSLHKLIYKNFLTSSLIPIFAIELVLIVLYFGVSYFISYKSQETLSAQAQNALKEISLREGENINKQFQEVSRIAEIVRDDHERFFKGLEQCDEKNTPVELVVHKNGALYKPQDNGGASIYYSLLTQITPYAIHKAKCSEMMDPLLKSVVERNPMITQAYFNSYDDFNRLYPYMEDAPTQYGPTLHMEDYNFYYLADEKHNPQRKTVWTSAYLDPAGQGWMISNIVPIYRGDFLEGVTGLDVTINSLVQNVLSLEIPWGGSAFLVDENGIILAMSEQIEEILGLKELKNHTYESNIKTTIEKPQEYNLLKSKDEKIAKQIQNIFEKKIPLSSLFIAEERYIVSHNVVAQTSWHLLTLVKESEVYAPIIELKKQVNIIGYIVIFLMLLFYVVFFLYLMRKSLFVAEKIAQPIAELSLLTSDLGKKSNEQIINKVGIVEVDQLVHNFNNLSKELEIRTQEYIDSQLREKMKEKDAEIAYRSGLFESASSYLHNIGNSLTMLDAKTRMLANLSNALAKSGLGIQKVMQMLQGSGVRKDSLEQIENYLRAFENALSKDVKEELVEISDGINNIKRHAIESIRHQQDLFNQSQESLKSYLQTFNLKKVLESVCDNFQLDSRAKGITIHLECAKEIELRTMKFQLISGLNNVIKNAIEAIEHKNISTEGMIKIRAYTKGEKILIEVQDNGVGIKPSEKVNLLKSGFTTKKSGHGLGLHTFNNFLNANGGSIELLSKGEGEGTLVCVELQGY